MMDQIKEWDRELLVLLNSYHADWLDPIMYIITQTWFWIPFYIFLLYLIIRNYKKDSWLIIVVLVVLLIMADQITSTFMKPYFGRFRPSQEPSLHDILHIVNDYRGGLYGFASGHAANTFAAATFSWLLFRKKYAWTSLFFLWAAIMTYTRIYLGLHYPGDILVGGFIGALLGWLCFVFFSWVEPRIKRRAQSSAVPPP